MKKNRNTLTIPALKARIHFGEIMKRAHRGEKQYVVEKSGIPMVAVISAIDYERWFQEREERFRIIDRIRAKLPPLTEKEVEKDIENVIQTLRRKSAKSRS